jgi:peptidyl-prolyl cis-trans isomerase SurA
MRKLLLTCIASGLFISSGLAQTLFTYGKYPVSKQDFLKVYEKNSINKKPDMSETALREYLDLYSLFRMKVKEAELQKIDTVSSIQHELDNYRKQLAKNYLTDEQVTNKLVREAYDRMKEDVSISHILILTSPNADTTVAYRKIDSLYKLIINNKADFETLAKQFSEDRATKDNGGYVGYITALQTVYPIENMAYNTPVGKISQPFRTQFGYHILKVTDKHADAGEVKVAQILISVQKSKGQAGIDASRKRADSVETQLKNGASFEDMVKKYSEDKFTVNDGGVMKQFGIGRYSPAFEQAAFALKNPGDISDPVQTEYGFHIIKLIEKYPLKPFDSLQTQIKHKVDADSRAQMAHDIFFDKIKAKNGFKEDKNNLEPIIKKMSHLPDTGKNANTFKAADFKSMNQPLFTLAGKKYLQTDFVNYMDMVTHGRLTGSRPIVVADLYKMYVNSVINDFEEHKLVEENPEFKSLMEEYRDGIMLFELQDRIVWGKASKDSVGLKAFYEEHKDKYMWEAGFKGAVYKFKNETAMKEGVKMLNDKATDEEIVKKLNVSPTPDNLTIQRGRYEFSHFKDAPRSEIAAGKLTKATKNADNTYTVVKVEEVYAQPATKTLDEARGYVVAEYQDYLEKKWHAELRKKYPVKVNEDVFKSMVKK